MCDMPSIPIKEQCVFVCLLVCWSAFYRPHDICPLCGAASEYSESSQAVAGGPARARGQACTARAHARACRTTSQRKNRCADAFQKQNRTRARACCRIRNCRDFQKKGKKKTNMPLPKFSLQFAFSWSVYFSNRTESYLIFGRSRPWSARFRYISD